MKKAFILRIAPSRVDKIQEALQFNQIIIGWSEAKNLISENHDWQSFRQIIHNTYHRNDTNFKKSGIGAGNMWRFIREMNVGDYIIIPHGSEFYIAEIKSEPFYLENKVNEDTAYRRDVTWLNEKKSIPRRIAKIALQSRMKSQQTCAYAQDLIGEIEEIINDLKSDKKHTFNSDLRGKLVETTLNEIRTGRIDNFDFERLIQKVLYALGAHEVKIIPRNQDKGADLIAEFEIAKTFKYTLAVQAKHYQPYPPISVEPINQLKVGMEVEDANLGWVVTSGVFSQEAIDYSKFLYDEEGLEIQLIDGESLASFIIEAGLHQVTKNGYGA